MGVESPIPYFLSEQLNKEIMSKENENAKEVKKPKISFDRKVVKVSMSEERKKEIEAKKRKDVHLASIEAQERLAEILTDSPHLVALNGTEWEVRALKMGTQWLIAKKAIEVHKGESNSFGDVIKSFATSIPNVVEVLVLALLNDKNLIFADGRENGGYSELYRKTYDTLMWHCDVSQFADILLETLKLLDTNFFYSALDMLQIFRASVTETKRMRKKTLIPRPSTR